MFLLTWCVANFPKKTGSIGSLSDMVAKLQVPSFVLGGPGIPYFPWANDVGIQTNRIKLHVFTKQIAKHFFQKQTPTFCECMFSPAYAPAAFWMLNRPLAIGSAGGGLASAILYCLENSFREPHLPQVSPLFEELCQCGTTVRLLGVEVEIKSLVIGLVLGFFLGPLVEVLGLVRQWWSYQLRSRFRLAVAGSGGRSYRVLE